MTLARVAIGAAALLVASALAPSCAAPGSPLTISYLTAWDSEGATLGEDGMWTTTTDRGFDVHVLAAEITTYATTLVPCTDTTATARAERVRRWLAPPVAHAGHLENPDASMIEPDFTESITPGAPHAIGELSIVTSASYCRAHQLIGGRVDLSTETPTRLPSLTLAVEVTDASGTLVRTMDLSTTVATGTLADLPAAPSNSHAVAITWVRPLARLFDGIAWDDASLRTTDVAQSVLLTIAAQSRVEAVWSSADAR